MVAACCGGASSLMIDHWPRPPFEGEMLTAEQCREKCMFRFLWWLWISVYCGLLDKMSQMSTVEIEWSLLAFVRSVQNESFEKLGFVEPLTLMVWYLNGMLSGPSLSLKLEIPFKAVDVCPCSSFATDNEAVLKACSELPPSKSYAANDGIEISKEARQDS